MSSQGFEIKFRKELYPLAALEAAISAFQNLAHFNLSENKHYYLIKITKVNPAAKDLIRYEFSNYVLGSITNS